MENKPMGESSTRKVPVFRWSIGAKLTIIFVALVIIPMAITAYYNLTRSQSEVIKLASDNLIELSRSTAQQIGQLLKENQRTSATLAGEPLVIEFLTASQEECQALAPRIYRTLRNFAETHPDYDAPGLLDVNGIVVASLDNRLMGKDRSFRDYFKASIQGQPYISSILVGRATGRRGVFLTNPIVTEDGKIVGIDIVWLKADVISDIIDDVMLSNGGAAYLVDEEGVIVAHPNQALLYHSLGELTAEATANISASIRFGVIEGTNRPLIPESLGMEDLARELALAQGSGTYHYRSPLDQRDHVVGYAKLEELPWTVVVDLPQTLFLAPLHRLGSVALVTAGLVALITLLISILLVRSITHPIRRLTDAAIAVEQNQPFQPSDIQAVTSGRDEMAQLGRVFGSMVFALRRRAGELQALLQSSHDITVSLDLKQRLRVIADRAHQQLQPQTTCLYTVEADGQMLRAVVTIGPGRRSVLASTLHVGEGVTGQVARTVRAEIVNHAELDQRVVELSAKSAEPTSLLCVPLAIRERVIGVVTLIRVGKEFTPEDLRFLQGLAAQTAVAIENARLYKTAQQELSERKQAEEKLKHYSEHLEEMVQERTKELKDAQEQLVRREKLSVLGQMAGGVSHELRNPLGVISNAIYYLKMTLSEADETTREYLEMISSEVSNSEKIISDLLNLSRTRAAQKEKISISELISQALEKQPIPKGIEVIREISPHLPYLYVDPRQIDQVLINLIINAYQAMPKGGVLTIKAQEKEDKVLILITDTGVGISKENLSKLFEPLYTTKARGIGLGLCVSQNLTEVNGGEIKVKSKEGEGSTFTLILPTGEVN